ncbi:MAG: hypothetical protein LBQ62_09845 [Candidatus Accumulibacter sp.]|jgi:hypothetical protein|nr:hypothetical protein [Accumulibacter sp.]
MTNIPTQAQLDAARSSGLSSVGTIDVNNIGSSSLQLLFAKFQLALSESAKQSATGYINDMQKTQEEQKHVAALLNEARQQQANAKTTSTATPMSADMLDYMNANNLAYDRTGNDTIHLKEEWDVAIKSLQARSEALGTDTQQKMVFVNDFMGQYNSYLQGANSAIQQSNQTLAQLAKVQ